eukprot:scaffold4120_cov400-Prasinococcus_capsulatus_cf.AAC.13
MPGVEASVEQKWAAAARKQTRGSSATAASALQTKASVAGEVCHLDRARVLVRHTTCSSVSLKTVTHFYSLILPRSSCAVRQIFSVAPVVFGATMIGLAIGFVLLRVEAVVEGEE